MDSEKKQIPFYTKGPWQKANGTQIIDAQGNVIAQTHAHRKVCLADGSTIGLPMGVGIDHEYELQANTNLIAQAPNMLEFLELTLKWIDKIMDTPTAVNKDDLELFRQCLNIQIATALQSERSS